MENEDIQKERRVAVKLLVILPKLNLITEARLLAPFEVVLDVQRKCQEGNYIFKEGRVQDLNGHKFSELHAK